MDTLEQLQWTFICLQTMALIYFNYYVILFARQFGNHKHDILFISCLVFIELDLLVKIVFRSVSIVGIKETG